MLLVGGVVTFQPTAGLGVRCTEDSLLVASYVDLQSNSHSYGKIKKVARVMLQSVASIYDYNRI